MALCQLTYRQQVMDAHNHVHIFYFPISDQTFFQGRFHFSSHNKRVLGTVPDFIKAYRILSLNPYPVSQDISPYLKDNI